MSAEHDLQQLLRSRGHALHAAGRRAVGERRDDLFTDSSLLFEAATELARVGERIDAQQHRIQELESLVAKSGNRTPDVRADAEAAARDWRWAEAALVSAAAAQDRLQHFIDCADTPLMRDVLHDRDAAEARATALTKTLRELHSRFGHREHCDCATCIDVRGALAADTSGTDTTADFRRSVPESATKPESRGPVSGAGGNT